MLHYYAWATVDLTGVCDLVWSGTTQAGWQVGRSGLEHPAKKGMKVQGSQV